MKSKKPILNIDTIGKQRAVSEKELLHIDELIAARRGLKVKFEKALSRLPHSEADSFDKF